MDQNKQFQFLLYRADTEDISVNALVKDETIWLTQKAMAELFGVQAPAISKHLRNVFSEGELQENVVVSKMEIPTPHGAIAGKTQHHETAFYNLDAITFLGNLKSTADICKPKFGRSWPNENKGKKLNAFSFQNSEERFDLEYYKNRPGQLAELKEDCSGTEAEKTLRHFKRAENINPSAMTKHLEYITEELEEAGVCLTDKQLEKLLKLVSAFHNNSRLWGLSGWKPVELARMSLSHGMPAISFGPGLQKAFADGTMNKEELIEGIRKLGLDVID